MSSRDHLFDKKIELVKSSLISIIKKFQEKERIYFCEEELRSHLYSEIFNVFETNNEHYVDLIKDGRFNNKIIEQINPVRAEYGKDSGYFSNHNISHIDIAILSKDPSPGKNINNFERYCDIIIELKYSIEKTDSQHGGFRDDIRKVINTNSEKHFLGLAICFDIYDTTDKFYKDYKDIEFREINIDNFVVPQRSVFALYITPKRVFISKNLKN